MVVEEKPFPHKETNMARQPLQGFPETRQQQPHGKPGRAEGSRMNSLPSTLLVKGGISL